MFSSIYVSGASAARLSRPTSHIRTVAWPPPSKIGVEKDTLVWAMVDIAFKLLAALATPSSVTSTRRSDSCDSTFMLFM